MKTNMNSKIAILGVPSETLRKTKGVSDGTVEVLDAHGRLVVRTRLTKDQPFVQLSVKDWAPGLYLARLWLDDVQLGATRFTVTP